MSLLLLLSIVMIYPFSLMLEIFAACEDHTTAAQESTLRRWKIYLLIVMKRLSVLGLPSAPVAPPH